MAIFKSSNSGIPFGNTAGRPSSPGTGQPYFNGELQRLELYTGATYGWQNIVAETPGVTGYTGTISETSGGTITITGTNFASGATASIIGTDGTEYVATSTTVSNLTQVIATFGAISASLEPYDIKVTNSSNLYGVYYDILTVNDKPIWTTAAGSLGTYPGGSVSIQLVATDEENNSLTYSLVSGSLPTGLTLSSSGLISGTNTSNAGTYTFTVSVSDSTNTAQSRVFSITSSGPNITGGTLSSDSTYYYRTFTGNGNLVITGASLSADILVIGGGGTSGLNASGQGWGAGGGAGGAISTTSPISLSGTKSIVIGAGGAAGPAGTGVSTTNYGGNGTDSYFDTTTYSAKGGGGGANAGGIGQNGGCGGGSNSMTRSSSTQTSPSGYTSYGNAGGIHATLTAGGGGLGGTPADTVTVGGPGRNTWSTWLSAITPQMTGVSGWGSATSGGYIGGGGSGGTSDGSNTGGGVGGGGSWGASQGGNGVTNTGSGGGSTQGTTVGTCGYGGSGIVIVRYTKAQVGG